MSLQTFEPPNFELGTSVMISGLDSRPELNGTTGVVSVFENETLKVKIETGEEIDVKPTNLTKGPPQPPASIAADDLKAKSTAADHLEPTTSVMLSGLDSRPELNGTEAIVTVFENETYKVIIETGEEIEVKASNLTKKSKK